MACIKSFCGCCNLRTGTIIVGAVSLISSILFLYLIICCILVTEDIEQIMTTATNRSVGDVDEQFIKVRNLFIGGATMTVITSTTSLLLVVGAVQEYIPLLIPWIVVSTIDLIIAFVAVVFWLTTLGSVIMPNNREEISLDVLCLIGGIVVTIYLLMVVYSLFEELKEGNMKPLRRETLSHS